MTFLHVGADSGFCCFLFPLHCMPVRATVRPMRIFDFKKIICVTGTKPSECRGCVYACVSVSEGRWAGRTKGP